TLISGDSRVVLNATVNDLSNPKLDADYNASIDAGEFRRILKNASLPLGTIHLAGHANYENPSNLPPLKVAKLTGTLDSKALEIRTPSLRTVVRDIGARYQLNDDNAEVRDLHAGILGGLLTGELTVRDVSGASDSRLNAS